MTDDQLKAATKGDVLHIPMTLGAVVLTYNVPEARSALKFTGDTIAGIYLGDIKKWNDPKLVADNPDLKNVDQFIVVIHRSDGSGTTFAFTDYLSSVSDAWKNKVGKGTAVNWPTGLGGQGSAGVTGEVKQDTYAIGYVELIYAVQNKLGYGDVREQVGQVGHPEPRRGDRRSRRYRRQGSRRPACIDRECRRRHGVPDLHVHLDHRIYQADGRPEGDRADAPALVGGPRWPEVQQRPWIRSAARGDRGQG